MTAGKILGLIVGAITALVALGLIVGGAGLAWAYGTQRDDAGFIDSPTYELTTTGYAITSSDLDMTSDLNEWFPSGFADVRLDIESVTGTDVFVGIWAAGRSGQLPRRRGPQCDHRHRGKHVVRPLRHPRGE